MIIGEPTFLRLPLELLLAVVEEVGIEVLATCAQRILAIILTYLAKGYCPITHPNVCHQR